MATPLQTTIKEYKELREQLKVVTDNLKELREVRDDLYSKNRVKDVSEYNKKINEQLVDYKNLQNEIEKTAETLSGELGDSYEKIIDSNNIVRQELRETTRRMRELRLAGEETSDEYLKLQNRSIELGNVIKQTTADISTGALTIGGQMKQLGTAMLSLDFDQTIQRANTLTKSLQQVSWTNFVKGINSARVAFSNLGKTLLANPIFLVATAVIGLGVAIYKLMKETGLLTVVMDGLGKVFEVIMKPLNLLINGFKQLLDAIGLTNNAAKEHANIQLQNAKEDEITTKSFIKNSNKRLQQDIIEQEERLKSLKLRGQLTVEEERKIQTQINYNRRKLAENSVKEQEAVLNTARKELNKFEQDNFKQLDKLTGDDKLKYLELKSNVASLQEDVTIANNVLIRENQRGSDALYQIHKNDVENEKKELKERQDNYKEFITNRIEATRRIKQMNIELIDDDYLKDLAKIEENYRIFLEDLKRNTSLNAEERKKIEELAGDIFIKDKEELNKKYGDIDKHKRKQELIAERTHLDRIDQLLLESLENRQSELEKNALVNRESLIDNIVAQEELIHKAKKESLEREIKDVKQNALISDETKIKLTEELNEKLKELADEYVNIRGNAEKKVTGIIKELTEQQRQALVDSISSSINLAKGGYESLFGDLVTNLTDQLDRVNDILDTDFENKSQRMLAFAGATLSMINGMIGSMSAELNRQLELDVSNLNASYQDKMNNIQAELNNGIISQQQFNEQQQQLQLDQHKKEVKIRKEAFEEDKKLKIASATISMLQGIMGAWSGAMQLPFPASVIVGGLMSALITGIGIANINAIKATQFNAGSLPNTNSPSGSTSTPSMQAPQFTFQGNGNNANETGLQSDNATGSGQTIVINNSISAVDIQDTLDSNNDADYFSTLTSVDDGG